MQALRTPRDETDEHEQPDGQEGNNRQDLQGRKARLDSSEVPGSQQVNPAQNNDNHQGHDPLSNTREPVGENLRGAGHFQSQHHDEHDPVEPAGSKTRPAPNTSFRVGRERTRGRDRGSELGKGIHHGNNDQRSKDIGDQHRGTGLGNGNAGAHKEPGADRATQRHHLQVEGLKLLRAGLVSAKNRRLALCSCGCCLCVCYRCTCLIAH